MPKQQPELLVDGKPFVANPSSARMVERMLTFLNKLPDNEVLTIKEFHRAAKIGENAIYEHKSDAELQQHVHITSGRTRVYFGNPRAIQKLKVLYAAGNQ